MVQTGKIANLNKSDFVVTHDGVLNDFAKSSFTDAQFTNNGNNTAESSFSQTDGTRIMSYAADGSVEQKGIKYQNVNALTPFRALPYPSYARILIEMDLSIKTGNIHHAGAAIAFADEDLTQSEQLFVVGLFYDGAASGSNGLEIVDPEGTTTQYTSADIVLTTDYILQIEVLYNENTSTDIYDKDITINAWLDGVKVIDGFTIHRGALYGDRLDGSVGLYGNIPAAGGTIEWNYWCCNRFEHILSCNYDLSALHRIPRLNMKNLNVNSEGQYYVGPDSLINVYARNAIFSPVLTGTPLATNLVMQLNLNNNTTDQTGNYDGTLGGTSDNPDFVDYKTRKVCEFVRANEELIDLPDISVDWNGQGITVAFWVIFNDDDITGAAETIWRAATSSGGTVNHSIRVLRSSQSPYNMPRLEYWDSGGSSLLVHNGTEGTIVAGQPMHILFTVGRTADKSQNESILYINGVKDNTSLFAPANFPTNTNRAAHAIGAAINGLGSDWEGLNLTNAFDGRLWDFIIWNRVVDADEVTGLYESTQWQNRWTGFLFKNKPLKKFYQGILTTSAHHYSSLLDNRNFQKTFTDKKSHFILTDSTDGLMPNQVPEISTNNVQEGDFPLTFVYYQQKAREIILNLAAQEDYLAWVDLDLDLHHEPVGLNDRGRSFSQGDEKLLEYFFDDETGVPYTRVEVQGMNVWAIVEDPKLATVEGGKRTKIVVRPDITTQARAERLARQILQNARPIQMGKLIISSDYTLGIGEIIRLTLNDTTRSFTNTQFVIIQIFEDVFSDIQTLIVAQLSSSISDFLYELYLQAQDVDNRNIDIDASKTNSVQIDFGVSIWVKYHVETHDGSAWSSHAKGETSVLNRGWTILSAILGNRIIGVANDPSAGVMTGGLIFQIGTGGQTLMDVKQTALVGAISEAKIVVPANITHGTISGEITSQATATWETSVANDKNISEAGFYVPRAPPTAGQDHTTHRYGTVSTWSPYNSEFDLITRMTFTPFSKTSSDQIRVTFTIAEQPTNKLVRRVN